MSGARGTKRNAPFSPFGLSEPSEKQEQVAFRETAPLQVRVGGPRRAKDSQPAFSAAKGGGVDVGVQMGPSRAPNAVARQVGDHLSQDSRRPRG